MKLFRITKLASVIFHKRVWALKATKKSIYLTFDDGPNPEITPFILDILLKFKIKATFFCVGENVKQYPEVFQRILAEGHQVGNHTFKHEKASETSNELYLNSINEANTYIKSKLFRPPYGRLSPHLARIIAQQYKIIMWTWLSYDFDPNVSVSEILKKANKQVKKGDILVLHDNTKIAQKQRELLPQLLELLKQKGFEFDVIH